MPVIILECPGCKKTQGGLLDRTDPPGTARVVMLCPECAVGDFSLVDYFNARGEQIDLEGKPMTPTGGGAERG